MLALLAAFLSHKSPRPSCPTSIHSSPNPIRLPPGSQITTCLSWNVIHFLVCVLFLVLCNYVHVDKRSMRVFCVRCVQFSALRALGGVTRLLLLCTNLFATPTLIPKCESRFSYNFFGAALPKRVCLEHPEDSSDRMIGCVWAFGAARWFDEIVSSCGYSLATAAIY